MLNRTHCHTHSKDKKNLHLSFLYYTVVPGCFTFDAVYSWDAKSNIFSINHSYSMHMNESNFAIACYAVFKCIENLYQLFNQLMTFDIQIIN